MSGLLVVLGCFFKEVMLFVSYVKNNAFPQPLSENEEKEYLKRMAEGDQEEKQTDRIQLAFGCTYREDMYRNWFRWELRTRQRAMPS